ncbi:hypothetical protein NVP1121O_143 [Vibrio phage 1.121.O._10N.286.46.C4]|nr:hypothetical protein NVP1121O_143 [Vibrio phage 1.121.O._10N.286.46.C4]
MKTIEDRLKMLEKHLENLTPEQLLEELHQVEPVGPTVEEYLAGTRQNNLHQMPEE